jgi:ribA/ribD-fused uncharacterized protein
MINPPVPVNLDPTRLINWFGVGSDNNPYNFLSNGYVGERILLTPNLEAKFDIDYVLSAEHLYQASKAANESDAQWILRAPTPFGLNGAKSRGRSVELRHDWESIKFDVMRGVLACKFASGSDLATKLMHTGPAELVEGNTWGDTTWGVDLTKPNRPGRNWLGVLLMARRAELFAISGSTFVVQP